MKIALGPVESACVTLLKFQRASPRLPPRLMLLRLPTGAAPHDAGTGSLPACENIKTRTRACPHPAGAVECPEWRKRRKGGERAPAARDCRDSDLYPPGGARAAWSGLVLSSRLEDGVSPTDSGPIDSETAFLRSPTLRPRRAGRSSLPQSTAAGRASTHPAGACQCSLDSPPGAEGPGALPVGFDAA
jgi:hypothetical protein